MTETSLDSDDFVALTRKIADERGFQCANYKERCLRRRIAVRMRARGVHTYPDYARLLDADVREYDLLLDALTINVTKLFRNWETFEAISREVIPPLWARGDTPLRVWSAGCASGEETYSLAILFHRHAVARGQRPRTHRVSVLGTDIDRNSLTAAGRGSYLEPSFADTPSELRAEYFSLLAPHAVHPEITPMVRFAYQDLLRESPPPGGFHLIVCRNVIIYFDRVTQEALFQRFFDALVPGGFLVLGRVETLLGSARQAFLPINTRERIFRRP